ncbi:MAG: hypothetical protein ABI142_09645 [Bryocella sp.]
MKIFLPLTLLLLTASLGAQTTPGKLSFAFPQHPGRLELDQSGFKIIELSAQPNGQAFTILAEDGDLKFRGFLFVWPQAPHFTSEDCRNEMLATESQGKPTKTTDHQTFKTAKGIDVATALFVPESGASSSLRAFIAQDDLCADLTFTYKQPAAKKMLPMDQVKAMLNTITFDPQAKPSFRGAFAYATVESQNSQFSGAASAYAAALALVGGSDDPVKWRRVTTDQLSMALGISGELRASRAANEAAIKVDPSYPMYYYDLACADAEEGNAAAAESHLQQAFARKRNTLPGESMPDPTQDDSLRKLKDNKNFWAFVETLGK